MSVCQRSTRTSSRHFAASALRSVPSRSWRSSTTASTRTRPPRRAASAISSAVRINPRPSRDRPLAGTPPAGLVAGRAGRPRSGRSTPDTRWRCGPPARWAQSIGKGTVRTSTASTADPGRSARGELVGAAGAPGGLAAGAHQQREATLDRKERPGLGPAEGASRPHTATFRLELAFDYRSTIPARRLPEISPARSGVGNLALARQAGKFGHTRPIGGDHDHLRQRASCRAQGHRQARDPSRERPAPRQLRMRLELSDRPHRAGHARDPNPPRHGCPSHPDTSGPADQASLQAIAVLTLAYLDDRPSDCDRISTLACLAIRCFVGWSAAGS